jgi:hypothetical protein
MKSGDIQRSAEMNEYSELFSKADAAGRAAAEACKPVPMQVVERANPLDDSSAVVKRYAPVASGVCGFAWVNVRPGNCGFARWMKKEGVARKGYYGGMEYWVSGYGQSMEKKEAYAGAFAKVLGEAGIKAYPQSRMD